MNGEVEDEQERAAELYEVLRERLAQSEEGQRVFTAFAQDPDRGTADLAAYLRRQLPQDRALAEQIAEALGGGEGRFTTLVTGGQVDQIINIARLGVLNLTVKRYLYVFRSAWQVAVTLLFLLLVGGGVWYGVWRSGQPRRMTGDFNIAIAQFGQVTDQGKIERTGQTKSISNALFHYLQSAYRAAEFGLEVQLTQKNIPLIEEDADAERVARQTNADIVIYGNVSVHGDTAEFYPRFFLAKRSEADELTGPSRLECPISFDIEQVSSEAEINVKLRSRAAILLSFTQGIVYKSVPNLDVARYHFERAIAEAESYGTFEGQEALYLFAAAVNRLQGNYDQAHALLDYILTINPEYARAYHGRGNIYYQQGVAPWDNSLLTKAFSEYEKALKAGDQPPEAYIQEKANVAMGNIYLMRAQRTLDPDLIAKGFDHYDPVVTQYERTKNESLEDVVAIAYFGMGTIYEKQHKPVQAIRAYLRSARLTHDRELEARARKKPRIIVRDFVSRLLSVVQRE